MRPSSFPYRIQDSKVMKLGRLDYVPYGGCKLMPTGSSDERPVYVINMPVAYRALAKDAELLTRILNLFKNEAFSTEEVSSAVSVKKRVGIVLGINTHYSIDKGRREAFHDCIDEPSGVEGVPYRLFGFQWFPKWSCLRPGRENLYEREKAYKIVKVVNPKAGACLLHYLEHPKVLGKQLDFQQLRQRIITSSFTTDFADHLRHKAPKAPIYYGVMDADCLSLRRCDRGLLTLVNGAVKAHKVPSAISCGYRVKKEERLLIRIGVKLDMYVRMATNKVIPYGAYFPEPASFFRIAQSGKKHVLGKLSFLGDGNALETRRLIQNGREQKIFDDNVVFLAAGGVVTTTPERMKTKRNRNIKRLDLKTFKLRTTLQAIRGVPQSHASPKPWADALYIALGHTNGRMTNVTKHMMYIFKVYDPISRMFDRNERYSSKKFDRIMANYRKPLTPAQKQMLAEAKRDLRNVKMPAEKIDLVERAAKHVGKTIHAVLEGIVRRLSS